MKIDLKTYLENATLNESLLLNLLHDERERSVVLVYDFAAEAVDRAFQGLPPTGFRDFRMLRFHGVWEIDVSTFKGERGQEAWQLLQDRISKSGMVIQWTELDESRQLSIHLDCSFEVRLCFEWVEVF